MGLGTWRSWLERHQLDETAQQCITVVKLKLPFKYSNSISATRMINESKMKTVLQTETAAQRQECNVDWRQSAAICRQHPPTSYSDTTHDAAQWQPIAGLTETKNLWWCEIYTDPMPFPSPNHQCENIEAYLLTYLFTWYTYARNRNNDAVFCTLCFTFSFCYCYVVLSFFSLL